MTAGPGVSTRVISSFEPLLCIKFDLKPHFFNGLRNTCFSNEKAEGLAFQYSLPNTSVRKRLKPSKLIKATHFQRGRLTLPPPDWSRLVGNRINGRSDVSVGYRKSSSLIKLQALSFWGTDF